MTPDEAGEQLFKASELLDLLFKLPDFSRDPDYDREGESIAIYEAVRDRRIACEANNATDFDNCLIPRLTRIYLSDHQSFGFVTELVSSESLANAEATSGRTKM